MISGPIAAGKSTLADAVVRSVAAEGRTAAMIEFDHVVDMIRYSLGSDPMLGYRAARRAAAGLVAGFCGAGVDAVIIEGDFWNRWARSEFDPYLGASSPRYVTLTVSYATALARVGQDPLRRPEAASRDPEFLRLNNDDFHARLADQPASDLVLDGELPTAELLGELMPLLVTDAL